MLLRTVLPLPLLYLSLKANHIPIASVQVLKKSHKDLPLLICTALLVSFATPVLLLSSYRYISPGVATTLHFVYPVFVYVLELLFLHIKLQGTKILCYGVCAIGIYLLNDYNTQSVHGNLLALLSGAAYALYIILLDRCTKKGYHPLELNFLFCLIGTPFCALYCIFTGGISLEAAAAWGYILAYAVLGTVIGATLFQYGVRYLGGEQSAVYSCFEPITSVFFSCLLFRQIPQVTEMVGVILIIFSVTLSTARFNKQTRRTQLQ